MWTIIVLLFLTLLVQIGLCNTRNIVDLAWLAASLKAKKGLPVDDYLLTNDKEAESKYDFSMQNSLANADEMQKKGTKVLTGWSVHVCKGVAGNKAPPAKELKLIVENAGGAWKPSLAQGPLANSDFSRLLIITSDPEKKSQTTVRAVKAALADGATKKTTSWLFGCMMKQEVSFEG